MKHDQASQYEPAVWRLVDTGHQDGATNMAIDEAIMEAVAAGTSPPTLRVYGWDPACLSLGLSQPWDVVDSERCTALGWEIVRRTTGGRAILHVDELTYSVSAPEDEPRVEGGIRESYRRLSEALVLGLESLGLRTQRTKPYYKDHGPQGPACFDGPNDYEITVGQMKLLGSAQARKRGMVLQHGTLPLHGDITRIVDGLAFDLPGQRMAARSRLRYRATTLQQSLGRLVPYAEVARAFETGFAEHLQLTFQNQQLSPAELARAAELREEKYANDAWTRRV
jgi:lipoate-protein ligase A